MSKKINERYFNGKEVLKFNDCTLRKDILDGIDKQLTEARTTHNKVYCMRVDLIIPTVTPEDDNNTFSQINSSFIKQEKRAGYDPRYVAVRETTENQNVHYHMFLILNGSKTQDIGKHIQNLNTAVNTHYHQPKEERSGLVNDCTKDRYGNSQTNGIMIRRGADDEEQKVNDVFRQASYLAKDKQKGQLTKGTRELFVSHNRKP